MITTATISLREFLEAFLIIGVFLGISRKLKIKKEFEIVFAAFTGVILSLVLSTTIYIYGDRARGVLTRDRAELLESYLMIFSGFFLAYVIFSLHNILRRSRGGDIIKANSRLRKNSFNLSLFFTIIFLVFREGFEIALFTASSALFSEFMQNFIGLLIGFSLAAFLGISTFLAYVKFPINKIFKVTEYMVVLLGASMVQNGVTELVEQIFNIDLGRILSLPLTFLPEKESPAGHLIGSFIGLDRDFSLGRLIIMIIYITLIYFVFKKREKITAAV